MRTAHPRRAAPDKKFEDATTPLLSLDTIEVRYGGIRGLRLAGRAEPPTADAT